MKSLHSFLTQNFVLSLCVIIALVGCGEAKVALSAKATAAAKTAAEADKDEIKSIEAVIKDDEVIAGFFTLYRKPSDGSVHLRIKADQLGKEFIHTVTLGDGVVEGGHFRGQYRDNKVLKIIRHFDRVEFVQANTLFYLDPESPLSRAADANVPGAVLAVAKVVAEDKASGDILIDVGGVFIGEALSQIKASPRPDEKPGKAFTLGKLSKDRSKIVKLASYPDNTLVVTDLVYEDQAPKVLGGEDVTDSRYVSAVIQHNFIAMPATDYQPRRDDYRVGFFTDRITDLTSRDAAPYKDVINRWHLVKKDPTAEMSDPVAPITWWIENTTPYEFRDLIKTAGLRWNSAFEKAGFSNAIQIKVQPDDATWDAGDIRYNVLRWTSSPTPPFGGYGPSFSNPRTGQIIGADIMLEFAYLTSRLKIKELLQPTPSHSRPAGKHGKYCDLGYQMQADFLFADQALLASSAPEVLREQLIKDSIYMLTLHEIGHTLGLTHNMRASQLLPDVFDPVAVAEKGLSASVMDYEAVNVAPGNKPQTLFYQNRPGPYDDWAITYAYSEFADADEAVHFEKILARASEPQLTYGNDADDMRSPGRGIDPHINIYDLSSDAIGYAEQRLEHLKAVQVQLVESYQGASYQKLYNNYVVLMNQFKRSSGVVSRYVGGVHINRLPPGSSDLSPYEPVSAAQQRRAMKVLNDYIFAPNVLEQSQPLFSKLQRQRRGFDFFDDPEDPKIHEMFLSVQKNVLAHLLHPKTLRRVTDSSAYGNEYQLGQMMRDLTQGVFAADMGGDVSSFRQYLQIELVTRLAAILNDGGGKFDALARSAVLVQLEDLAASIKDKARSQSMAGLNTSTQAHVRYLDRQLRKSLLIEH